MYIGAYLKIELEYFFNEETGEEYCNHDVLGKASELVEISIDSNCYCVMYVVSKNHVGEFLNDESSCNTVNVIGFDFNKAAEEFSITYGKDIRLLRSNADVCDVEICAGVFCDY